MNLLALETSTERLSLALSLDGTVRAREIDAGQRHSELLLEALHELLAEAGTTIAKLDAIAFGQGPGSFVGVRIACGLAQGLALGADLMLAPVPTPMALAEQANAEAVLVAVDARMGEYYLAAYRRDEAEATGWRAEIAPMLATQAGLPALSGKGWQGIGSAFQSEALAAALGARYAGQFTPPATLTFPSASDVARIAERSVARAGKNALVSPQNAAPLYLRNHVALTIAERAHAKVEKAAVSA